MTQRSWPWSTAAGLGDGAAELNEALSREFLALYFGVQNPAVEGVSRGVMNELAVSGAASPLTVETGSGICYGLYINDAAVNLAVTTPAVGTTGGRVVLQTNWAGTGGASLEARTRAAVVMNADGNPAIPALTQVFGTTWEISLATFTITTGGVITLTDDRTFRQSTMEVPNAALRNSAALSVMGRAANSVGRPADIVAGANDRVLGRTGNALSFLQLTIGMIPDALITLAKLANLAGVSVLGRAANSAGVMGAITATANDRILRRVANVLDFGQLTAGMFPAGVVATAALADNSVDDTKVGNRVPQFWRRKGGNAANWATAGTSDQTPGAVRMQAGAQACSVVGIGSVNFTTAFSGTPLVFVTPIGTSSTDQLFAWVHTIGTGSFSCTIVDETGAVVGVRDFHWLAIGPE